MNNCLDCLLLKFETEFYLIPKHLLVRIAPLGKAVSHLVSLEGGSQRFIDGEYEYQFAQSSADKFDKVKYDKKCKLALVAYNFENKSNHIAYPFHGVPHELSLLSGDLVWLNEAERIAQLGSCQESALVVRLP